MHMFFDYIRDLIMFFFIRSHIVRFSLSGIYSQNQGHCYIHEGAKCRLRFYDLALSRNSSFEVPPTLVICDFDALRCCHVSKCGINT